MDFFNLSFWQSIISNLCASVLGVGLGVFGALWLNNYVEKRTEKERKKKILKVLTEELKENLVILEMWQDKNINFNRITSVRQDIISLCVSLYTESWDAFSNGGELEWINDPVLLNILATCYNRVSAVKFLANKYFDLAYSDNRVVDQDTLEFIGKNLKDKVKSALLNLVEAEKYIKPMVLVHKLNSAMDK